MVATIKKGASKAEIEQIFEQIQLRADKTRNFDAFKYCGKIKFENDALEIQKKLRNEWE